MRVFRDSVRINTFTLDALSVALWKTTEMSENRKSHTTTAGLPKCSVTVASSNSPGYCFGASHPYLAAVAFFGSSGSDSQTKPAKAAIRVSLHLVQFW